MKSATWISAFAAITVLATARASEPSQQEKVWETQVMTLVEVIAKQTDHHLLTDIVSPSAFIAPFDMNRTESFMVLPDRLMTTNVVSARAYMHPSVTAASDIVADLTANAMIDPQIMQKLVPQKSEDIHRADATMARWFETSLEAKAGEPIAVIVLYDDGKEEPVRAPALTFVLIRGEITSAGQPRITRGLYGSMQSAVK